MNRHMPVDAGSGTEEWISNTLNRLVSRSPDGVLSASGLLSGHSWQLVEWLQAKQQQQQLMCPRIPARLKDHHGALQRLATVLDSCVPR